MKHLIVLLLLGALSGALAHTEVTVLAPLAGAAVAAPAAVSLRFSEPVNLRFSMFRVMKLPAGQTPEAAAKAALALKAGAPQLLTLGTVPRGMAAQLRLPVKPRLAPGAYLIAWSVLSDDGHPVVGHQVFQVR
ncbi:copper resistance CopC family protein [Deinococcus koreensis]|uniref:Copper resistance protein CopC n=1 Tax=Deinococcus koreensis TaxID=2054903 RepID=A0A2K3UTN8_9DEIO|nr:copper resistance protein CopC [Deinococcus koreensis]PNY79870.1 copper resistance protein CopC [Deinococcus koreensis]